MIKFEKVSRFADVDIQLPERKTTDSAGYDFVVAEDIIVPSIGRHFNGLLAYADPIDVRTLEEVEKLTKEVAARPTLVPTGIKCHLELGQYLELSVRSSCPLKYWLVLANGVGIIDRDYLNNEQNEGEIYFQVINLSPYDILLKAGDRIGQGIIKNYIITDDDAAFGKRTGGFGSTSEEACHE